MITIHRTVIYPIVVYPTERSQAESVSQWGTEEGTWAREGKGNRKLNEIRPCEAS